MRPKFLRNREFTIRRHDTDDRRGFPVHSHALPNDVAILIEVAFPGFVSKNRNLFGPRLIIRGCEIAAHDRRNLEDLEKILRYVAAGVTLGIIFVAYVDG